MTELKIGKIEQLREKPYQHAPFDFEDIDNEMRVKLIILITNVLMDNDGEYKKMYKKAEKIVDLLIKCFE